MTPDPARIEGATIDPSELRGLHIPTAMRGYSKGAVDHLRELLADAVEGLNADRAELQAELGAANVDRDRLGRELARSEAERKELAAALEQAASERQVLVESFDDASVERESLVARFQQLTQERQETQEYMQRLEEELTRHRDLEAALTQTVASAELSGREIRAHAQREAELIVSEAHAEADRRIAETQTERERLLREVSSLLAQLETARRVLERPTDGRMHVAPTTDLKPGGESLPDPPER